MRAIASTTLIQAVKSDYPPPMHHRGNVSGRLCVYLPYHIFKQTTALFVINIRMSIPPIL
jgi:hypothetical protein